MLKGLKRKLVILSVLVAAFAAVSAAPTAHAGGVFCDEAPIDSGCTPGTLLCCNDYGGCWCQ